MLRSKIERVCSFRRGLGVPILYLNSAQPSQVKISRVEETVTVYLSNFPNEDRISGNEEKFRLQVVEIQ